MLAYYLSASNEFSIRTAPFAQSASLELKLQNMFTLVNSSQSISPYSYNVYESLATLPITISGANVGDEWRAEIIADSTASIWHGTINVFTSQSIDKPNYTNQIPLENVFISRVSDNEYIIID